MYEYSTLPNSWEEQNVEWEHYYAESELGRFGNSLGRTEFETMCITMDKSVEVLTIEAPLDAVKLPQDVYEVYLAHHFEGRELPCQLSI
jgi:hypothetical protein